MIQRACTIDGCERPHRARGYCKSHWLRWRNYGDPTATPTADHWATPDGTKRCRKCEQVKPLADFYATTRPYAQGRSSWCKRCTLDYKRDFAQLPEQVVARKARRRSRTVAGYGLTLDDFDTLLAAQGGLCAVCRQDPRTGRWREPHVDHDHSTGKVRGILCHPCNTALGLAGEDPARLRALAAYLDAHT